jgi:hypothetical protein
MQREKSKKYLFIFFLLNIYDKHINILVLYDDEENKKKKEKKKKRRIDN